MSPLMVNSHEIERNLPVASSKLSEDAIIRNANLAVAKPIKNECFNFHWEKVLRQAISFDEKRKLWPSHARLYRKLWSFRCNKIHFRADFVSFRCRWVNVSFSSVRAKNPTRIFGCIVKPSLPSLKRIGSWITVHTWVRCKAVKHLQLIC